MQSRQKGVLPGLILIGIGFLLLVGNLTSLAPWIFFLGFGVVFIVAHFLTRRFGFLIVGCILSAIGVFSASEGLLTSDGQKAALFFAVFGAAFLAVYLFRGLWQAWWPLVPAGLLMATGTAIALLSSLVLPDLEQWAVVAKWWPVFLVLFGVWLLVARRLSPTVRLVTGISLALVTASFVVVTIGVGAAASAKADGGWSWLAIAGRVESRETIERSAKLQAGGILIVTNSSGSTTIHRGETSDVKLIATKHAWASSQEQARKYLSDIIVNVDERPGTVEISWTRPNPSALFNGFSGANVDYDITVPMSVSVETKSSSGRVLVREVDGDVRVHSSSGDVELRQIGGAASVVVTSGEAQLQNIGGPVEVEASSGRIVVQDIRDTFHLETHSGSIDLSGDIRKGGEISATSGNVRLSPGVESSFWLDASTRSGSISVDPRHKVGQRDGNAQTVTVGTGGPTVNVRVTSGNITLR